MNIKELLEALDDLNKVGKISKNALLKDNATTNKEGKAYLTSGGDSFNYNRVLNDILEIILQKDSELYNEIIERLPEIKEKYRIRRNKSYKTIKQNYNDQQIATYKYKDSTNV